MLLCVNERLQRQTFLYTEGLFKIRFCNVHYGRKEEKFDSMLNWTQCFVLFSDSSGWYTAAFGERSAVWDGHRHGGKPDSPWHGVQSWLSVHLSAERQTGENDSDEMRRLIPGEIYACLLDRLLSFRQLFLCFRVSGMIQNRNFGWYW